MSLQLQYNLLGREVEWELVPQCLEEGLGMLSWSPLAGGWLTGKYRRDQPPTGANRLGEDPRRGIEAYELRNTQHTWRVLEAVGEVAERAGCGMAQVALRWLLDRPGMSSVILGARTIEQLDTNLATLQVTLTAEDTRLLTEASAPGLPLYPYAFLEHYAGYDMWEWLGTRPEPPPIR